MASYKIAPSLLCMDLLHVEDQLAVMNRRADYLHVDLMDTRFVAPMGLPVSFVEAIAPHAKKPVDCHIMVADPMRWVAPLARAGAACIIPHAEAMTTGAFRILDEIKAAGCKAGAALSPASSLALVQPYLHLLDRLTIMTIEPGYPGARFLPEMVEKLRAAAALRTQLGLHFEIEMDGSLCDENFAALRTAGCDVFVAGAAALFGRDCKLDAAFDAMYHSFDAAL